MIGRMLVASDSRPPGGSVETTTVALFGGNVFCQKCERFDAFSKRRVLSKGAGTWMCGRCNSTGAALGRDFEGRGGWPSDAFKECSSDEQVSLYRWADGKTMGEMKKLID